MVDRLLLMDSTKYFTRLIELLHLYSIYNEHYTIPCIILYYPGTRGFNYPGYRILIGI